MMAAMAPPAPRIRAYVAITSVNPPTPAARAWAGMGWAGVVVAGDAGSPGDWSLPGARFLSLGDQAAMGAGCEPLLPRNHYCRKNLAYLQAAREGAEAVIDTDDDNVPRGDAALPPFAGTFRTPAARGGAGGRWVNVYRYFTDAPCWPRGLPLDAVRDDPPPLVPGREAEVGLWQGLADREPDVDAVYRLTDGREVFFREEPPVVLDGSQWCPTNSQNTTFPRGSFPLLYLPHTVSFRFTDILRGLVAQQALARAGRLVGFHAATVRQDRNEHDLMEDFESEVPCYLNAGRAPSLAGGAMAEGRPLADNLLAGYRALARAGVVGDAEVPCLEAWLGDMAGALGA